LATIVDIARQARVSASTVSHVLNGTRRVAPATARAVRDAIASANYSPNAVAQALKTSRTRSVGIAVSVASNPYFGDIVGAIERECANLGTMVFLSDTRDDPALEFEVVRALLQRRVDGLILAPSPDPERRTLRFLAQSGTPCVLVDRMPDPSFDQVGVDNFDAMRALTLQVIGRGHRRIGYVGGSPGFETTLERVAGFRAALAEAGLPIDEGLIEIGNASTPCAAKATMRLWARAPRPTALVTGNNQATIGAMSAVRALQLRIPADLSLVGFDDFEWADFFEPRLTLVAQPVAEIGQRATFLLMERIAAPDGARRTLRLKTSLVERSSCGAPP
jgi:LacI family transcriptional regulator